MPRSLGRHYDDVIHPVTLQWRRCTTLWVVLRVVLWVVSLFQNSGFSTTGSLTENNA